MSSVAPAMGEYSTFDLTLAQFESAAQYLHLDPGSRAILRRAKRELTVTFPVRLSNGTVRVFTGFRVHHSLSRGPGAGGIRYHPNLTLDTVRALAMWSSWRAALVRIPFGGAYGGVVCDPANLTREDLEHLTRRFTTEISILIGPDRDIPSPDRSTDAQVMAWMMDTYSMHKGYSVPAVVTGKPVAIGGSQGWARASGRGTATLCRELATLEGFSLEGTRVAVQGCGPIGSTASQLLSESGCVIVALADGAHGIQRRAGLDVAAALRHYDEHDSLEGCPAGEALPSGGLATIPCDVLVLSGFERVDAHIAEQVQARLIVEGAYGAILPEADTVLQRRGIPVLPAVLGGAGGAIASYFEWVQDLQETFWSEQEINERLAELLTRALRTIYTRHQQRGISLRLAADSLAVQMVSDAHSIRGLYP